MLNLINKRVASQRVKYHILNMLEIKYDINQQDLKRTDPNFHSLEVVDRVSETQLQVSENLN